MGNAIGSVIEENYLNQVSLVDLRYIYLLVVAQEKWKYTRNKLTILTLFQQSTALPYNYVQHD